MVLTPSGMEIRAMAVQSEKASSPMDVIVEGMVTDVRFPHRANKPAGMLLHPLGMSTAFYSVSWHLYSQFQEIDNSQQLIIHVIMKKLLTLFAATVIGLLQSHATDVTPVLSPAPTDEVTNLATIKVTFNGLEMLTTPYLSDVNATLTNTISGKNMCASALRPAAGRRPTKLPSPLVSKALPKPSAK